jgi:two-component system, NarL family, response regulator LiaR
MVSQAMEVRVEGKTAVVVDHQPLWVKAIEQVLVAASVEVVATTTSFAEASKLVEEFEPDMAVVDPVICEGDPTGLSWLAETSRRFPQLKVIVLSRSDDPAQIDAAIAQGASVYVVKKAHGADIAAAARQIYTRSFYLSQEDSWGEPPAPRAPTQEFGLTKRELEILRLTAQGLSNGQMAKQLWVTVQTVKFHLSNIYSKLRVSNRTAASRVAQLNGLLQTDGVEGLQRSN